MNDATASVSTSAPIAGGLYYRHTLPVRIMHWINVIALTIIFMSGLMIFNAHPSLYWGKSSYSGRPPILEIGARNGGETGAIGYTKIFGHEFNTTGVLGLSREPNGRPAARAFPSWLTIPDMQWLSMARSWHFFFAWIFVVNGICYLAYSLWSRHLARALVPPRNRRGGDALQRLAEDHLPDRHLRLAAIDDLDGARDVAAHRYIVWR